MDEAGILDAAVAGDIVVALLRRASVPPRWQDFIKDALNLPSFGAMREALGAVVFCAVAGTDDGGPLHLGGVDVRHSISLASAICAGS